MNRLENTIASICGSEPVSIQPMSEGSFTANYYGKLEDGREVFIKSSLSDDSVLLNEKNGLFELGKANVIGVPQVYGLSENTLITEWIRRSQASSSNLVYRSFGKKLAELHKFSSQQFGFPENNVIGATPQINLPQNSNWADFVVSNRFDIQFEILQKNGYADHELMDKYFRLRESIPTIIEGSEEKPALIHGDLWSGNFIISDDQEVVLIDPACSYSHREMEFGMTTLFGGFPQKFYEGYQDEYPLLPGSERRIKLYSLYHIVNHFNLFGDSYRGSTQAVLDSLL